MEEGKRELHYTYLDTIGRPVVVVQKSNLVEQHIQDFEVYSINLFNSQEVTKIEYFITKINTISSKQLIRKISNKDY